MTAFTTPNPQRDLAAEFLDRSSPLTRVRKCCTAIPAISPAVVLLVAVIVFGVINARFLLPGNLSLITQQVAMVGTLALAQTLDHPHRRHRPVCRRGDGLRLDGDRQSSVDLGVPGPLALVLGLLVGVGTGAINGLLVTRLKLLRSS